MATTKGKGRGFASMNKDKQRMIASKGGKAAHKKGTAHTWTSEKHEKLVVSWRARQKK